MLLHNLENSFLASYRIPRPTYSGPRKLPAALAPVWVELRDGRTRPAFRIGYDLLRSKSLSDEHRAALLSALATAAFDNGMYKVARQMAHDSLALYSNQWLAHRTLLSIYIAEKDYRAAAEHLKSVTPPARSRGWDEPLTRTDRHLLRAACAWMTKSWDQTAAQLLLAFPAGVASMPPVLQEDWFRLAFYRERPADAEKAARELIKNKSTDKADVLIQTLVHRGWHKEALTLYRDIYDLDPTNELLRRRVVGLCIREGQVQEARRLMELGALRLAS